MKKFVSILLCAVLFLGMLPLSALAADQDVIIIEDDFEDYDDATKVTNSVKGWTQITSASHSLVTEESNHAIKFALVGTEKNPRIRKDVSALAGEIYMMQADVKVSSGGIIGFYIRHNSASTHSLVRFGGDIRLDGDKTGYKSVADKWMTYQLFFKLAAGGENMEVYLRMWGEGVVDSNGQAVPASAPVIKTATITSKLLFDSYTSMWMYHMCSFAADATEDYAMLDNMTLKKLGEELADANGITVNGEALSDFDADQTDYTVVLPYGTTEAVVAGTAGSGKTVTVEGGTITAFPQTATVRVTNDALGIYKEYKVHVSVNNTADFDLLLADDFESYGDAEKVTNSVKGWSQITAASHCLVTEGSNHALKFAIAGTEKYPRARKNITARAGDTIQVQADLKLSENGYVGLYLRNSGVQESVSLLKSTDVLLDGHATGYEISPDKWFTCNIHVKFAEKGGTMEIYAKLWGEGVVDKDGNTMTAQNPAIASRTLTTGLDLASSNTVNVDFMCNFSKGTAEDYVLIDNVQMTRLHSDVAGMTLLTVNDIAPTLVEGTANQYSIMLPYGTAKADIVAQAGYGRTVSVSQSEVTTFPTEVTILVKNASAGVSKTYIVTVDARRTATQMEGELMFVYGGANGIFTMTYDDGLYNTAAFLDQMGEKYNVYSTAMMIPSKLSAADREQWQALFDRGYIEPQNHSMTHLVLPSDSWIEANDGEGAENNTPENYQYEIVDSKAKLEQFFGNDIICFAASNNTLSDGAWEVVKGSHYAVRLGYKGVNSLDPQETTDAGGWYNLKCYWFSQTMETLKTNIDVAATNGGWFIGGCHGIGDLDRAGDISCEDAEALFAYVAAYQEENKLWSTTFSNATKYVKERQNSLCYVDWIDGNVVVEVVSNGKLDARIFNHALTVKAQVPDSWTEAAYVVDGETVKAKVFTEGEKSYAYINVVPGSSVEVVDAGTLDQTDANLKFEGASVTLQNDMSVTYRVLGTLFTEGGYTNPYVEFVFDGVKRTVSVYDVNDAGDYLFTFRNIAPDQVGDVIYATLYATKGEELLSGATREYSIADYCYNMLGKSTDDAYAEFRTLLVDLLNYAAASQLYTGHNTDKLANANLTEEQKAWGTQTDPSLTSTDLDREYATVETPEAEWAGATLILQDAVTMRLTVRAEDLEGLEVRITDGTNQWTAEIVTEGEKNYVYFEGLHAGQMRQKVYLTIYRGETAVSNTLQYSIASYAYTNQAADAQQYPGLADLVKAMMRYGDSAYAFVN